MYQNYHLFFRSKKAENSPEKKKKVSSLNNPSNIEMIEVLKTIIIITCYYYRNNISLLI
jgi:hypothetical protein